MKLLTIKAGGILALALYAPACSQPNGQPMNSVANNPATMNTTPTPTTRDSDIENLPKGWTSAEILERGLNELIAQHPCLASKNGSTTKSRVINVSAYVYVEGLMGSVVAAHALREEQADAEELKEAETIAKQSLIVVPVSQRGDIRKPQKWHGNIEVKVKYMCP